MSPQDAWDTVEVLRALFSDLDRRTRARLKANPLLVECDQYQDVVTQTGSISDALALGLASTLLKLYRIRTIFLALSERCDVAHVLSSSVAREREELFSMTQDASEARLYALYVAALLHERRCAPVTMMPVASKDGELTPDFEVDGIGYGECKDLRRTTPGGVWKNLWTNLKKANEQLAAAQQRKALAMTMACVDIPPSVAKSPDDAVAHAIAELWPLLPALPNTQVVLLTHQYEERTDDGDAIDYPFRWRAVRNPHATALGATSRQYLSCLFPSGWYVAAAEDGKLNSEGPLR